MGAAVDRPDWLPSPQIQKLYADHSQSVPSIGVERGLH